jgi:hypothetical protein
MENMFSTHRTVARLGLASLIGLLAGLGATRAEAACDTSSLTCSVGSGALSAQVKKRLGTEIDSGWMSKGPISVRTRFTIDPVGDSPIVALDMPKGAAVEATWSDGFIDLRPVAGQEAQGSMAVHYTLTPSLEASIYGITIAKDATQLVNMIPGASFNYDSQAQATFSPWGFAGAQVAMPSPSLDQSTLFSIGFDSLGVDPGTAEGSLAIQASAKPTFKYTTTEVRLDGGAVNTADGSTRLPAVDGDFMDVAAHVSGSVSFSGTLDVKPVVVIDSVAGIPTFGLTKFSFSAVSKDLGGQEATPISFSNATIHVPLPNVKVSDRPLDMGSADAGKAVEKTVTINSTGEMGALLTFTSSDPQFTVPSGQIRVGSKSSYDLKVIFKPSGGPAAAKITVKSNDPDSPEQSFRVAANGASLEDPDAPSSNGEYKAPPSLDAPSDSSGCSAAPGSSGSHAPGGFATLGLGLGLALVARRRRSA